MERHGGRRSSMRNNRLSRPRVQARTRLWRSIFLKGNRRARLSYPTWKSSTEPIWKQEGSKALRTRSWRPGLSGVSIGLSLSGLHRWKRGAGGEMRRRQGAQRQSSSELHPANRRSVPGMQSRLHTELRRARPSGQPTIQVLRASKKSLIEIGIRTGACAKCVHK